MKHTMYPIVLACLFLVQILALSGCSVSYGDLLAEYDENFSETIAESALPSVLDDNFDQASLIPMLWYKVNLGEILMITAPTHGLTYKWEIYEASENTLSGIQIPLTDRESTTRQLSVTITSALFDTQKDYLIKLTVTTSTGSTYIDTADLIIKGKV